MSIDIKLGDVVRLRKTRPCGSYQWEVVRVGADIGLECLKCQRRVLLARDVFRRRVKESVSKGAWLTSLTKDYQPNRRAHQ